MQTSSGQLPVVVIGAGPVGLAAAAHLAQRKLPFLVLEASSSIAANLQSFGHVRLFSPWRYNVDQAAYALLSAEGWRAPPAETLPTAGELVNDYLTPLARTPALRPHLRLNSRAVAIGRDAHDKVKTGERAQAPFVVQFANGAGIEEVRAQAVIDASGTWSQPNPLGAHGLAAIGEHTHRDRIAYGMPDLLGAERARYAGRKVLVVGAGHSAAGNLIALAAVADEDPRTRIAWAVRGKDLRRLFGGGDRDGLPARGALGQRLRRLLDAGRLELHRGFGIRAIEADGSQLRILPAEPGAAPIVGIDRIIGATGARPELTLTRELRVRHDPWLESTDALAPLIDPNVHSCGTVRPHGHRELSHPENGFYAIGAKSYGRAPNFLMATGYEQARSVVAALAGDLQAADDVQLDLPETGVCSTDLADAELGCCGGEPSSIATACCAADEQLQQATGSGCGCSPRRAGSQPLAIVAQASTCCSSG